MNELREFTRQHIVSGSTGTISFDFVVNQTILEFYLHSHVLFAFVASLRNIRHSFINSIVPIFDTEQSQGHRYTSAIVVEFRHFVLFFENEKKVN